MVRLSCKGAGGSREYRIFFPQRIWDFKGIGAWSKYTPIVAVRDNVVILADGGDDHVSESLKLDRADLTLVDVVTTSGFTTATRADRFSCAIMDAET
jgi:hypothetical protein